jgi:DNA-binding response OmpR family regulator
LPKVLIAEDDALLRDNLHELLQSDNFLVDAIGNGDEALAYLRSFSYDLMILDWDLPGLSGVQICREYRATGGVCPILILTGKSKIEDKEAGLDAGADDYLTKPFHPKELKARLRALLRRPANLVNEKMVVNDIVLDSASRTVTKAGQAVALQPMEFSLLEFFMRHPGEVYNCDALAKRVWDSDSDVSTDAIYASIGRLRKKIDSQSTSSLIHNIHGVGYKFQP